jgi:hypothetical protein
MLEMMVSTFHHVKFPVDRHVIPFIKRVGTSGPFAGSVTGERNDLNLYWVPGSAGRAGTESAATRS